MLLLKNARVIPELTEDYEGVSADILIEDGIIQEIAKANSLNASVENTVDMTGKTVIPGLIEGHLHLDLTGNNIFAENVMPDAYRTMSALKLAQDNLKMGYTTVRDLGDRNNIIIGLAKAIDEGLVVGPDVLPSGKIISPTEAGNEYFGGMYLEADSPYEMRKAVRRQYQAGAQWIKIMGTGAVMNPGATPGAPIVREDELQAACDQAIYVNRPVAVHCHGSEGIKMCIRCGVRTVEHSSIMDDECIRMYKESNQTFMMPTMSATYAFAEMNQGFPEHYITKAKKILKQLTEGMIAAREAGVKMGWGTDAGVYTGSHGNGIYEFRVRTKHIGFTPLEVLIQATKNNSEILMIDDKVGTIKVGKRANLACYDGCPDKDVEDLLKVYMVIKSGKIVNL